MDATKLLLKPYKFFGFQSQRLTLIFWIFFIEYYFNIEYKIFSMWHPPDILYLQVFSFRLRDRGPDYRGFVQLPLVQDLDGNPAEGVDPAVLAG